MSARPGCSRTTRGKTLREARAEGDGVNQRFASALISGTVARLGVRRRSPLAGMDRWMVGTSVRSRSRACRYRRQNEPAAADRPCVATICSPSPACSTTGWPRSRAPTLSPNPSCAMRACCTVCPTPRRCIGRNGTGYVRRSGPSSMPCSTQCAGPPRTLRAAAL
jgi:hypothetical protein